MRGLAALLACCAARPGGDRGALDVLAEPNRRLLLVFLAERGECTVNELVAAAGLRQPQVSKHLKTLAEAALVQVRPEGRRRHYRRDGRGLKGAHDWFAQFEATDGGGTFMTMTVDMPEAPEDLEAFMEQSAAGLSTSFDHIDALTA